MMNVAVVAHRKKKLDGGLGELRRVLADRGYPDPLWYDAATSRETSASARRAVDEGADLLFIWGGDGTVQRCVDAVARADVTLAILPEGTANLLATNLEIPKSLVEAVDVGLSGVDRRLDVGVLNGQRFTVMAGVGFDAVMMHLADDSLKDHLGRLAYVWTGTRATRMKLRTMRIKVDGKQWFSGDASCVLLGQFGVLTGSIIAFPDSSPDDGLLEAGVVTVENAGQWMRVLSRKVLGHADNSPLTEITQGRKVDINLSRPTRYELDGGARKQKKRLRARIEPGAIVI